MMFLASLGVGNWGREKQNNRGVKEYQAGMGERGDPINHMGDGLRNLWKRRESMQ